MSARRLIFFGNERLATGVKTDVPVLKSLIKNGYDVAALVLAQNEIGNSRDAREPEIVQVANDHNIPILKPQRLSETYNDLANLHAEVGVLVAYGKMVPQAIIDLFPSGIVNIHPSLLPKHRGPTPLESVILSGETETGVSLMKLAAGMDSGPIFSQTKVSLSGHETKQVLADLLLNLGKEQLIKLLPSILDGTAQLQIQDESNAQYDALILKSSSVLDFNKSALDLEREIRAFAGWPRSRTQINNLDIIVNEAHAISGVGNSGSLWIEANNLGIYTANGIIVIDRLTPAGKKDMTGSAFLAGYKVT